MQVFNFTCIAKELFYSDCLIYMYTGHFNKQKYTHDCIYKLLFYELCLPFTCFKILTALTPLTFLVVNLLG